MNCLFLWLCDDWVLDQLSIEIPSELQLPKAFSWALFWKNESLSDLVRSYRPLASILSHMEEHYELFGVVMGGTS